MRHIHLAIALAIACIAGLFAAAPAGAAVSCAYSAGTHQVTIGMTAQGDLVQITRSGSDIIYNGLTCGGATVTNTDKVVVNGTAGRQNVEVNLSNGPFEPGFAPEGSGTSEIEFQGNLGGGTDLLLVSGGSGPDNFTAGTNGVNVNADNDADIVTAGVDQRSLRGQGGNDTLSAAGGLGTGSTLPTPVTVEGDAGEDTITGGDGADDLDGAEDKDAITGGEGIDLLTGGPGNDSLSGGTSRDTLNGDAGDDTVDGGPGVDFMFATTDPDGNDVYVGGGGVDTLTYAVRGTAALDISLDGVANDGRVGSEFDNVMPDIEHLVGSRGPNVITGSDANDSIEGGAGSDTISGGGGADILQGGDGLDTLNGGEDADDLLGGSGVDQLNGGDDLDRLTGGLDNDVMSGGLDDDVFIAEAGPDGTDDLSGGLGRDAAVYVERTGNLTITLDNVPNDGLTSENDNVHDDVEDISSGSGHDQLTGSPGPNLILGGGGNDTILGAAGDDSLHGFAGDDTLTGGDGEDEMLGDEGADHFHAMDGGADRVDGGVDADTDVVLDSDPFDTLFNVP